ncbi:DUF4267 domain-containing protein [Actinomadura oligospora]|uniref:DUF4267 domain-containing protein n=1 Tax=Actinomadura oligospora TaxID=111804 RepID=UPI0004BB5991|nr:DUF4267 domain-containing protein [Actinomadura oligospora]
MNVTATTPPQAAVLAQTAAATTDGATAAATAPATDGATDCGTSGSTSGPVAGPLVAEFPPAATAEVAVPAPAGRLLSRTATGIAIVTGLLVTYFGLGFLLNPHAADGFGIKPWPTGNATGYFDVKGFRDLAIGGAVFTLLALRQHRALAWIMLFDLLLPVGDMLTVMTHGGTVAFALAVHGSAAALLALGVVLQFIRVARDARAAAPAA